MRKFSGYALQIRKVERPYNRISYDAWVMVRDLNGGYFLKLFRYGNYSKHKVIKQLRANDFSVSHSLY